MKKKLMLGTGLAAVALVAGALVPGAAVAAQTNTVPAKKGDCSLVDRQLSATSSVNQELTDTFTQYANTAGAWTGGDSTYSMKLSKGRTGWFFSDSFLGDVADDGSRPKDSPFVNNSVVIQKKNGEMSTITGGTPQAPDGIIPPEPDGRWYWIGDPVQAKHGTVQVPLLQFERTGSGQWDFQWSQNRLAILNGDTLQLEQIIDMPSATGINWGSWTLEKGNTTYIYGIADPGGVRSAYVAKATGNNGIAGAWTYWDGSSWSTNEHSAVPVIPYVANEFSVEPYRDGYLLVTQDTSELFSTKIIARTSCSPTGPFGPAVELYRTPETGIFGSYGSGNVFTYNAHEHPDLRKGNTIVITYNVNTFDNVNEVYDDASIYRPRFVTVELKVE